MGKYKVRINQNLYDIAIELYGSIEGLFDLLISNKDLSMTTDLKANQILLYHEDFILNPGIKRELNERKIHISNGERNVYQKQTSEPLRFVCHIDDAQYFSSFIASGDGTMIIDWGDNSELEKINLTQHAQVIEHYFDNDAINRRIKCYGYFRLIELNATDIGGEMLLTKPLVVDSYICNNNILNINSLLLFKGTYKINLRNCLIHNLRPIQNMSLQTLDIRGVEFINEDAVNEYLIYIANNYGERRSCAIYMDKEPSEIGMKAIHKIINEPEWNANGKWKFIINGKTYMAKEGK